MNAEQAAALREPFPPELIGKLPKAGITLDFVGHGAVRDRLLQVDPEWTWEPFATDEVGLPALDEFGNLWIRLTICGVTRPGVGDGPSMKERIGDAIRNAGMSFGVALDLWIRGHGDDPAQAEQTRRPRPNAPAKPKAARVLLDGWQSLEEQDEAHRELAEEIKNETAEIREHMKSYRASRNLSWPMGWDDLVGLQHELDRVREVEFGGQGRGEGVEGGGTTAPVAPPSSRLQRAEQVAGENGTSLSKAAEIAASHARREPDAAERAAGVKADA